MPFKERLELLIKSIQQANPRLRIEDISTAAGYKPQTLTQSMSSGRVSERMYNIVVKAFKDGTYKEMPVLINNTNEASFEALIRLESLERVNASYIAEIYGHLKQVPATKVLQEMEQMAEDQSLKRLEKLKGR